MTINLTVPHIAELKPRITVFGVGGAGGNAVNNMIESGLEGVEFVIANTDAQAMTHNAAQRRIQMGNALTQGLGAGSQPQIGAAAAEEALAEILDHLSGAHMAFITAGMGGGTGTGAAPVIARAAKEQGILTVGVVTKPFQFEGVRRMQTAERGIEQLAKHVDTLIVIPNQNLFRIANEKTTFAAAFAMADQVLYSGVASITELMTKEGLINLDFADVRAIMSEMGKAMMGTGEATGERRAIEAAEAAISNPLLDDVSMRGARGLLISITGGPDLTLYVVDDAATRIREEVDPEANIILGATFDDSLEGTMRVSVVATGLAKEHQTQSYNEEQEDLVGRTTSGFGMRAPLPPMKRPQPVQAEPEPEYAAEEAEDEFTSLYDQEAAAQALADAEAQRALQPPVRTMAPRAPRMPAIDEFPPHARKQMQARQSEISGIAAAKAPKKKSLFERLAQGMGKQADAPAAHVEPALAPKSARKVEAVQSAMADEDDQLEIPAFLRRQAN